jgi:hypothetical protein
MQLMTIIWLVGIIPSLVMCSGWFYSKDMSISCDNPRESVGCAVVMGLLYAVLWPIGIPLAWCMTGFAEHGWWRTKCRH